MNIYDTGSSTHGSAPYDITDKHDNYFNKSRLFFQMSSLFFFWYVYIIVTEFQIGTLYTVIPLILIEIVFQFLMT